MDDDTLRADLAARRAAERKASVQSADAPEEYERRGRTGKWDNGDSERGGKGPDDGRPARKRARRGRDEDDEEEAPMLLPVKTLDGELALLPREPREGQGEQEAEGEEGEGVESLDEDGMDEDEDELEWEDDGEGEGDEEAGARGRQREAQHASALFGALARARGLEERRAVARNAVGEACLRVLQSPESSLPVLRELLMLCGDGDAAVCRLVTLSLAAVFRDVLPGYRVNEKALAAGEDEKGVTLSKEVAARNAYELGLLQSYRSYVATLAKGVKDEARAEASARCAGILVVAAGHFNYRREVIGVLVKGAASRVDGAREAACASLRDLFRADSASGEATLDAVIAVARAVRGRGAGSPAALVRCLVSLQFDDRLNSAWGEVAKERAQAAAEKKKKKKKAKKGKKGVDADTARDLKEAEAERSLRARADVQARVVETTFEVYFRLLKEFAAGKGGAANFPTLEAALAGLAKQAKYINVDFMADLFKCLFSMLPRPKAGAAGATGNGHSPGRTLPVRVQLRMILAIHAVLLGQGNALQVDQSFLVTAAMAAVQRAPFVGALEQAQAKVQAEGGQDSAQGARQQQRDAHASMLAVDVLDTVVSKLATGSRHYYQSTAHAAADASLHAPVGASLGSLAVVSRALAMPGICDTMLGNEGGGVEASLTGRMLAVQGAASSGSLWELTLLSRHFHPQVRSSAAGIAKMRAAKAAEAVGTQRPHDIAKQFDDSMGTFNPAPKETRSGGGRGRRPRARGVGVRVVGKGDEALPSDAVLAQALKAEFARR